MPASAAPDRVEDGVPVPGAAIADSTVVDAEPAAAQVAARLSEVSQALQRFRACVHTASLGGTDSLGNYLLFYVAEHGPLRAADLADSTQADPSTVSRQVATLVGRGWLERRADPLDGRASLLHTTTAGRAERERIGASRTAHYAALMGDWSVSDQLAFARLLGRFAEDFAQYRDVWIAALSPDNNQMKEAAV